MVRQYYPGGRTPGSLDSCLSKAFLLDGTLVDPYAGIQIYRGSAVIDRPAATSSVNAHCARPGHVCVLQRAQL